MVPWWRQLFAEPSFDVTELPEAPFVQYLQLVAQLLMIYKV